MYGEAYRLKSFPRQRLGLGRAATGTTHNPLNSGMWPPNPMRHANRR